MLLYYVNPNGVTCQAIFCGGGTCWKKFENRCLTCMIDIIIFKIYVSSSQLPIIDPLPPVPVCEKEITAYPSGGSGTGRQGSTFVMC